MRDILQGAMEVITLVPRPCDRCELSVSRLKVLTFPVSQMEFAICPACFWFLEGAYGLTVGAPAGGLIRRRCGRKPRAKDEADNSASLLATRNGF